MENSQNNNINDHHPYQENILEKSLDEKEKNFSKIESRNESFTKGEIKQNSICTTEIFEPTFKYSDTCSVTKKIELLEDIKFRENPLVFLKFMMIYKFFYKRMFLKMKKMLY